MASRCISAAIASADLQPGDVDHINAHGSSTPLNDATESLAIRSALGAHADEVSVTGTKPFHGHALGASGAIEVGITCLTIRDGWVPPTLNLDEPGDGCDLDYVTGEGREQAVNVAVTNIQPKFCASRCSMPVARLLAHCTLSRGLMFSTCCSCTGRTACPSRLKTGMSSRTSRRIACNRTLRQ